MSIASELSALNGYILGAYDEISDKGGTVPANKNMANLATAIGTISTGGGASKIGDFNILAGQITPSQTAQQAKAMSWDDFLSQVGGSEPTEIYAGIFDPLATTGSVGVAYIFGKQGFQSSVKYFNGGNLIGSSLTNNRIIVADFGFLGSGVIFNGYNSTYGGFQANTTYTWFVLWK